MANVALLPTDLILDCWPAIRPFVLKILERDDVNTEQSYLDALSEGRMQAWVAVADHQVIALMMTEIHTYPRGKVCQMIACVGEQMRDWVDFISEVESWARKEGCVKMRPVARTGWSRVLARYGYRETHRILERDL